MEIALFIGALAIVLLAMATLGADSRVDQPGEWWPGSRRNV